MRTRDTIVRVADDCGYQIQTGNWQNVDPFHAWFFLPPDTPGCYAFYFGNTPVYIGQSKDLRRRLKQYKISCEYNRFSRRVEVVTPWGRSTSIGLKLRASSRHGDWLMLERRLIERLRPSFNKGV